MADLRTAATAFVRRSRAPTPSQLASVLAPRANAAALPVENSDRRVVAHRRERGHVHDRTHLTAPAPNDTLALVLARVVGQRRYAHQLGDLAARQAAEFGKRRCQGEDRHRPDALDAVEQLALSLEVKLQKMVGIAVDV